MFLSKGVEDDLLEFLADADPVVAYFDVQVHAVAAYGRASDQEFDAAALRRVFDGVAEEVEDDLVDAQFVEHRHSVLREPDVTVKGLIFTVYQRPDHGVEVGRQLFRRVGFRMQLDFAAFGLGHVEDVVDEPQQEL